MGALSGLVVADFSRVLAGPYATMMLADLGADVIKVESPAGDDTRTWRPPETADGEATYYLGINRNKRSVVFDLTEADDRARAHALVRRADVMVENFRPGSLTRFGLDYPGASALNPRLIYASITGFGSGGGADLPGYDLSVQAMSGLMSMTGPADGDAYRAGVALFDVMTGMNAVMGVLAALRHRDASGLGQLVEVNLMSTALAAMANHTTGYVASGTVPFRMGNAHPSVFPYEPLPTADGDLIVIAGNDGQFTRLCQVLDLPRLIEDERFATNNARTKFRDELRPLLIQQLRGRTRQEWFVALTAAGVPCAPINGIDEGIAFAEQIGLEPVVTVERDGYSAPSIRNPVRLHASEPQYHRPPPTLGQHTNEVLEWLEQSPTGEDDTI